MAGVMNYTCFGLSVLLFSFSSSWDWFCSITHRFKVSHKVPSILPWLIRRWLSLNFLYICEIIYILQNLCLTLFWSIWFFNCTYQLFKLIFFNWKRLMLLKWLHTLFHFHNWKGTQSNNRAVSIVICKHLVADFTSNVIITSNPLTLKNVTALKHVWTISEWQSIHVHLYIHKKSV